MFEDIFLIDNKNVETYNYFILILYLNKKVRKIIMAGQGRKKLTEEEKAKKELEKQKVEEQKKAKVQLFKDCDYINSLDDELILEFIDTVKTKYDGMTEEEAIKMLFKGFVTGSFEFRSQTTYTLP